MRKLVGVFMWLAFVAGASPAQDAPKILVAGPKVEARTTKVMRAYGWESRLDALKEKAAKEDRLIFWLQLVGELDGGL